MNTIASQHIKFSENVDSICKQYTDAVNENVDTENKEDTGCIFVNEPEERGILWLRYHLYLLYRLYPSGFCPHIFRMRNTSKRVKSAKQTGIDFWDREIEITKPIRRRNSLYTEAVYHAKHPHSELDNVKSIIQTPEWWALNGWKTIDKEYFNRYLDFCSDKVGLLRGEKSKRPVKIEIDNRFSKKKSREIRARILRVNFKRASRLSLTIDPKRYKNINEATKALEAAWNVLLVNLKKRYGRVSFVRSLHFSKEHDIPHLYVLIDRIKITGEDRKWIFGLWMKLMGAFSVSNTVQDDVNERSLVEVNNLQDAVSIRKAFFYMVKPLNGDGLGCGNGWCYWVTNARFYSMSDDVRDVGKSERDWEMEAIIIMHKLLTVTDEGYVWLGIWYRKDLEPLPVVLSDEWLEEHGCVYDEKWGRWLSPCRCEL